MLGLPSARLLHALAKPQLSDSDIQDYLDCLEAQEAAPGSALAPTSSLAASARPPARPARDGGMKLSSRVQEIVVSEGRCTPRQCELLAGGRVLVRVQGGPPQPFAIGRDVEDAVVTPAIPAGTSYEWTPPEPGRYFVRSEVYPSLRSEIRVLRPSETAEAVGTASSARTSTAFSRFGSMSAVDEFVPFPALKAAGTGSYSRGTQTGGSSCARQAGAFNPGPMLGRFQADSLGPDEEDSDDEGGGFVAPPAAGLRRRGHAAGAAPQQQQQQQQAVGSRGTLPELGRPAAPAGLDGFSVISGGSGGSPRSGSGSERSTSSAPLYVERRRVPGTLQSTYSAVHSGRSSYSDSRSGGSEERQPLLYSVGGQAGYTASYGPGGLRAYPAAGVPPRMGAEEARTQKCPRCRKEYLSTINQRRCIASHLGASGGAKAARGVADPKQLAEFWDGLSEAERRSVMAVKDEHNGERTLRELSCQILHRKRPGVTDGMAKEQRRLHLAGKMLHDFVTGELPPGGSQLVSVLSQVSEGTFLFERNAINRDEVLSGNNLEAGLGALVTKRLVGAHLAAKQAAAAAMQEQLEREQEDQEAQQAAKKGKQQQQQGQGQAGPAKKQTKGSKAKAKSAAPAAKAGSKPAAAVAAAAAEAPAEPAGSDAEADATTEQASTAGRPPPLQLATNGKASSPQQGGDDELSPPSSSGARYGISPLRASGGASQYTNFLFLAEEAAESAAADDADGWRTAGSGRPSSRASQAAGTKASGSGSSSQANGTSKAGGRSSGSAAAAAAAAPARSSSRTAERQAANGAAAAPKAAASTNGKLAQPPRSSTSAAAAAAAPASRTSAAAAAAAPASKQQQRQQPQPPREESFPALPAAAAGKPRAAAATAAAAPPGFSYAAAASKTRKDGSKQQAGESKQQEDQKPKQQQQQPQQPQQQAESWPVPGPMPGKGAKPSAPAPAAAAPAAPAAAQQPAAEPAAAPKHPETHAASTSAEPPAASEAPPAAAPEPAAEVQAATAAEAPAAAGVPEAAGAPTAALDAVAEAQRCASVTPPISDAGSPPPGPLPLPPGFAVPPAGWVGPDGAPLMPPPLPPGYYWAAMPAMPGVQFGNVDMAEVLPGGPWPYPPFYPPGAPPPFGLPPPGAMLPPGVPLPPHTLPYGEEGFLAPFPPGMPVPLPPEVTEQLAAAAAAHAAAAPEGAAEEKAAGSAAAATEAAPQPAEPAQPAAAPRKGFLALLQDAYGPAGAAQQPAAASRAQRDSSFDAAAAAAELQRRWQAAAPAAVLAQPPQAAAAEAAPSAPRSASKGRPPSRGSSSGSLGSKSGKASALGSSSGRASPAGGPGKPVVVAVRAWSSDDSTSDGPKWKIQAATQPQQAQQGGAATEQQQQQQQQ